MTEAASKMTVSELQELALAAVPMAGQLGVSVEHAVAGRVALRVPFRDDFLRPGGTINGVVMMALADIGVWTVIMSEIGAMQLAVTTQLSINFLRRPAPVDLIAEATLLKLGKRLAVGEVAIEDVNGALVAHATATYSIPPRPE